MLRVSLVTSRSPRFVSPTRQPSRPLGRGPGAPAAAPARSTSSDWVCAAAAGSWPGRPSSARRPGWPLIATSSWCWTCAGPRRAPHPRSTAETVAGSYGTPAHARSPHDRADLRTTSPPRAQPNSADLPDDEPVKPADPQAVERHRADRVASGRGRPRVGPPVSLTIELTSQQAGVTVGSASADIAVLLGLANRSATNRSSRGAQRGPLDLGVPPHPQQQRRTTTRPRHADLPDQVLQPLDGKSLPSPGPAPQPRTARSAPGQGQPQQLLFPATW